jgi:hypothetical protein
MPFRHKLHSCVFNTCSSYPHKNALNAACLCMARQLCSCTLATARCFRKAKCYLSLCFILIQLNVQYSLFLKSLLAQHVSDVTASIVRSTAVVYSHRFFGFWCVYSSDKVSKHNYKSHGINTPETI